MSTRLAAITAVFVLSGVSFGGMIHVDDGAPLGGDGATWETAFRFLQDALAAAQPNDVIRVAQGAYQPDRDEAGATTPGDRTCSFWLRASVELHGGYAGRGAHDPNVRDPQTYPSILHGDLAGDDDPALFPDGACFAESALHVLRADPEFVPVDPLAVLDGFTIRAGNANLESLPHDAGGGLRCDNVGITLRNCTFTRNIGRFSGGADFLYLETYPPTDPPRIEDCAFLENAAYVDDPAIESGGGALSLWGPWAPRVDRCTFMANRTTGRYAGALRVGEDCRPRIQDCRFERNHSQVFGGAASFLNCRPTLLDCLLQHNSAGSSGAAIFSISSDTVLSACRIFGNRDHGSGPAPVVLGGGAGTTICNCLFVGNQSQRYGALLMNRGVVAHSAFLNNTATHENGVTIAISDGKLANSILWNNAPANFDPAQPPLVRYCDIQGGWEGPGNFDADPHLTRMPHDGGDGWGDDPQTPNIDESLNDDFGDLALLPTSPCIDAGDALAVPRDLADVDADACLMDRWPFDHLGLARFHDDPATTDTGIATTWHQVPDMGAFEFDAATTVDITPCFGDLNCDGLADNFDIDHFIQALTDPAGYLDDHDGDPFPPCDPVHGDVNEDGLLNNFDIDAFVVLLTGS